MIRALARASRRLENHDVNVSVCCIVSIVTLYPYRYERSISLGRKFDAVMLRRSNQLNGVSGLCITKLDVLDGIDTISVCVGYRRNGVVSMTPPVGADSYTGCEPVYVDMPGWKESTVGVRNYNELPANARAYLKRIEDITETPIDIVSTGPDRDDTIVLRHPFE
jgi:adenylosuccinate synthase